MDEIKLGDKVHSKISGFYGTVTAICTHLFHEESYAVTAPELYNGRENIEWFSRCELLPGMPPQIAQ